MVERSRHLADRLPNSQYVVLEGMAHLRQLESPAVVAELILRALNGR
jgi:pimeloyl-ACP methyl ester carboxylesterase